MTNPTGTQHGQRASTEEPGGDDRIIGVAFRWSLIVLVLLAVPAVGFYLIITRTTPAPDAVEVDPGASATVQQLATPIDDARAVFVDVTAAAGIDFIHETGATGEKLLPETMGAGVAFIDIDNDGDPDLIFANGNTWPHDRQAEPSDIGPPIALYLNDGTGSFTNATPGSGLQADTYAVGLAIGDYDSDGLRDIYVTAVGQNRLFRNTGPRAPDDPRPRFVDVTETAGLNLVPQGHQSHPWSTSAGFFDIENDGDLDLFVCNYVEWSRELDFEVDYRLDGVGRAYGPPMNFRGAHSTLYLNQGDGTFADISEQAGLFVTNPATGSPVSKALGLAFIDVGAITGDTTRGDRLLDIVVANDTTQNFLFVNNGDATFSEMGTLSGVAFDPNGLATGAMGIDAARVTPDLSLAVAIGNFSGEMTSLFTTDLDPAFFSDTSNIQGVGSPSRGALTFGLVFADVDLDGWQDLVQVNGHLEEAISTVQPSQTYEQPAQLFRNNGPPPPDAPAGPMFSLIEADATGDLARPAVGRGLAYADMDADGDLDLIITQVGRPPVLLRNDLITSQRAAAAPKPLRLTLRATNGNTDAIGTIALLKTNQRTMARMVSPTRSYLSQCELVLTFGLANAERIESLEVRWVDGQTETFTAEVINQPRTTPLIIEQNAAEPPTPDAAL